MLTPLEFAAPPRTMLDLFSGLGGASQAMVDRGWKVVRVDIDPRFNPDIIADVRQFHLKWSPDLLWASPPCTDFSAIRSLPSRRLHRPPDMSCVESVFRLVDALQPRYWIMENAAGLEKELGPARQRIGSFFLWGQFPLLLLPRLYKGTRIAVKNRYLHDSTHRSPALRAKIPYQLSLVVAKSVETCSPRWSSSE